MSLSALVLLVEVVLELLLELEAEVKLGGGGGGGALFDPPSACAKSWMLGRSPDSLALEKSAASWLSWLAASESLSDVAVFAADFKFALIFAITDLYSAGSDC